jgi:hypothetical protein
MSTAAEANAQIAAASAQATANSRALALSTLEATITTAILAGVSIEAIRRQLIASALIGTFTLGAARSLIASAFARVNLAPLESVGERAVRLGAGFAKVSAEVAPPEPPDVRRLLVDAEQRAQSLLGIGRDPQESTLAATSALRKGVAQVRASVNGYVEEAASKPAREDPRPVVWVAERDACVVCLAYAGQISADRTWPGGLTFDPKRVVHRGEPFVGPPAHPHCRCDVQLVASVGSAKLLATSLQREAQRSIAKGWALPGEAGSASRRRALAALLDHPNLLPKSVVDEARRNMPTTIAA